MCFRDSIHKVFEATNINQMDAPSTSYLHQSTRNNELGDDDDNNTEMGNTPTDLNDCTIIDVRDDDDDDN